MPFIPVPLTAQFNLRGLWQGERWENTLYLANTVAWTEASLANEAENLADWWIASMRPNLHETCSLTEVYAVDLASDAGPTATHTVSPAAVGLVTGQSMPNNVSLCISFRTGARGRSYRGRNYVPGLSETTVVGNTVIEANVNALVAAYEELISPSLVVEHPWVVVSRYTNGAARSTGVRTSITAVVVVDHIVDSQRRRLPGRGQ